MAIKLNKEESVLRNELIYAGDAKAVNIDNVLVNLFMLLKHNGMRPRQRSRVKNIDLDTFQRVFEKLEKEGLVSGFSENKEATELWLRSNLANMVYRGNLDKEKISSLRQIGRASCRERVSTSV